MSGNQKAPNKRPLSPHLSIYKLPITALLSITHRITGFALYIGALLLAWWIIVNVYGCGHCINALIDSVVGKTFLVLWTLAMYFHMMNGIRHLCWDAGKGFKVETSKITDKIVIISAVVLTLVSWLWVMAL